MEKISGLEFAFVDRCLLRTHGIDISTLVEIFRKRDAGALVQEGPKSTVRRCSVGDQEIYLKAYLARGFRWWIAAGPYRRALNAFKNASRLADLGVNTAPVLAVVKRDCDGTAARSGLFTLSLFPAQSTQLFFRNRLSDGSAMERRHQLLDELAGFLFHIHEKGIYPKDFKHSNVLVRETGHRHSFYLVDYDGFLFLKSVSARRRLKNLYQIGSTLRPALSRAELRFLLQCYGERKPSLQGSLEALADEIEKRLE
jgi:serine/threonine protein kinase